MPEMHDLCDQDRVKQLEAELSAAQEALTRMKQESIRIRRASHPIVLHLHSHFNNIFSYLMLKSRQHKSLSRIN